MNKVVKSWKVKCALGAVLVGLVCGCEPAPSGEETGLSRAGIRSDVSGRWSFDVEVRFTPEVDPREAEWLLANLEIVPFEQAFPGTEKPATVDEPEPLTTDGPALEVVLRPLDAEVSPGDFAWRVAADPAPVEVDDDGVGKQTQAANVILKDGATWWDSRYRCSYYAFVPTVWYAGVNCVHVGYLGNAKQVCLPFATPYPIPFANVMFDPFKRRYYRGRITAANPGMAVMSAHFVTCL